MNRDELRTASQQLLQHYKRSGLTHVPRSSAQGIEEARTWLTEHLSATPHVDRDDSDTDIHAQIVSKPVSSSAQANTASRSDTPTTRPPATEGTTAFRSPSLTKPAPSPPATPVWSELRWMTPSKPVNERESYFAELRQQCAACRKCSDIVSGRKQTVFGVGPIQAKIAMFGEAPGADEDRVGEPFVGAAGQLLNKIIAAMQLKREEVYILNALRCRPPNNRTPTEEEIENCRPFFEAQLETIQPDYIICWGAVAVRAVLRSTESVGRLRGRFHPYRGAKVLVTYHPAYLLRNPDAKRLTWDDMQFLMRELGIPITPRSETK